MFCEKLASQCTQIRLIENIANDYLQGLVLLIRALWRNVEANFKESLDSLSRRTKCLDDTITYSHRREIHQQFITSPKTQPEGTLHKVDSVASSDVSDKMVSTACR
jgi:hypothetical protein